MYKEFLSGSLLEYEDRERIRGWL